MTFLYSCALFCTIISFSFIYPAEHPIRVLLSKKQFGDTGAWELSAQSGFIIGTPVMKKKLRCSSSTLRLSFTKGQLVCNGKSMVPKIIHVTSVEGPITFEGNSFDGRFVIVVYNDILYLINMIPLEEYVAAVLRSETWPGWPLEINKVLAVACRSYVMALMLDARKSKKLYDVKNTNAHQTYYGSYFHKRNTALLRRAVDETRGLFLSYEGKPILAMFDSCCGGVIPAHIDDVVDFIKAPYLARDYACTYCKQCSLYKWRVSYTTQELSMLLSKNGLALKKMRSVCIEDADKAGLVKTIMIKSGRKKKQLSSYSFYSLLSGIKSFAFSITQHLNIVHIDGVGYGHHVGLCQWGARQMVRELWDYRRILQFYYPKTSFMRLL